MDVEDEEQMQEEGSVNENRKNEYRLVMTFFSG